MLLLCFAAVLLLAVLVSHLAHKTVLSTAVLFLVAGFLLGDGVFGVINVKADDKIVSLVAEAALFAVLFTDGMRAGWSNLRSAWKLPGRALVLGMPLTFIVTTLLAYWLTPLNWTEAALVGAILAPTDPVFASALVGNERVPARLRSLLNVESGLNDGLALPVVVVLLSILDGDHVHWGHIVSELAIGIAIGIVVPLVAIKLEQTKFFRASHSYEPLNAVAIGLLVYGLGLVTHGNLFLAAFAAGITVATVGQRQRETFEEFGELIAETLKLGALLLFGALITPTFLGEVHWTGYVFTLLALFIARPIALGISFIGARLSLREQAAAAWFGPKGFASVVYGLLVLQWGIDEADMVFHLVAVTVVLSILLHSSTDVVVAKWFDEPDETPQWQAEQRGSGI